MEDDCLWIDYMSQLQVRPIDIIRELNKYPHNM